MIVKKLIPVLLLAATVSLHATDFYVAPNGTSSGDGSIGRPWDLPTAVAGPSSVRPGDTVYLRGGTYHTANYVTKYNVFLSGAAGNNVTVRNYPGERAAIDGYMFIYGSYCTWQGIEIALFTCPTRVTTQSGPWPTDLFGGPDAINIVGGTGNKFINLIIHDSLGGIFYNKDSQTETHGCLFYYCGWDGPDRGHGHSTYCQGTANTHQMVKNTITFNEFSDALQLYATSTDAAINMSSINNIIYMTQDRSRYTGGADLIMLGSNNTLDHNVIYRPGGGSSSSFWPGYAVGGIASSRIVNNYVYCNTRINDAGGNTVTNNTFIGSMVNAQSQPVSATVYPKNSYSTLASPPTVNSIHVFPNDYEAGRANIAIFNWQRLTAVNVNVSAFLQPGDVYELHNAANFYGDIITGTVSGPTIAVPMTGHTFATPVGNNYAAVPPTDSFPTFGTFIITKKTGGTVPANTPPTISTIPAQTLVQGASTAAIGFTVGDAQTTAGSLVVTASSSNPTLVPNANVVLGGSGSTRTVTVTPVATQTGSSTITIVVSDGQTTSSTSFTVQVTANTPPTISSISAQTIAQNASTAALAFTVSDAQTLPANLTVKAASSNTALVPAANIVLGGSGSSRTVTITPAANQSGTATITLTVSDGQASATSSFVLTVLAAAVNTPPTVSTIANQTVAQGTSTAALPFTVNDKETPAANLTVRASSSNPTLVPVANIVLGGSGANRSVTVKPAANQSGTAVITLAVSDSIATVSTSFSVMVTAVPPVPTVPVSLEFEAESGSNAAPMIVVQDPQAPARRYIQSTKALAGTATYVFEVPQSDTFVIWCKVLAPSYTNDSFFVSVDGAEDVFDSAEGLQSPNWQWSRVNGRAGAAPLTLNPRLFTLAKGTHTLVIRGREAYAGLDRIIITSDRSYVPKEVIAVNDTIDAFPNVTTPIHGDQLLANDSAIFGDPLAVTAVGAPQHGTTTLVNGEVGYTPVAGFTGLDTFPYIADDGLGGKASATVTVNVQATNAVRLGFEAESGTLVAPMMAVTDTQVPGRRYLQSLTANQGTVSYNIVVPKAATYVIWCKVLATNYNSDSFFVSVDGAEDIFDVAEGLALTSWQWSRVNGRAGSVPLTLNPRRFVLSQGVHSIVIRGREAGAGLDRVIITDDQQYVPRDIELANVLFSVGSGVTAQFAVSDILRNAYSIFGESLKISAVGAALNGSTAIVNSAVIYTPKAGFTGTDSFTYTVTDNQGGSATATITVSVK